MKGETQGACQTWLDLERGTVALDCKSPSWKEVTPDQRIKGRTRCPDRRIELNGRKRSLFRSELAACNTALKSVE